MATMRQYEHIMSTSLPRTSSCKRMMTSTSLSRQSSEDFSLSRQTSEEYSLSRQTSEELAHQPMVRRASAAFHRLSKTRSGLSSFIRSLLSMFAIPSILPTCAYPITPSLGRKITGTLFGNRRGHVSFAVQVDPKSRPVFLIELAVSTVGLVKEMSSGLLRIALECEKSRRSAVRLFGEPAWTMYCNGRTSGQAQARECTDSDWQVLSTVQSVSVGAGVIPKSSGSGELMFMRARFERVVGNRDSEAFYMLNPDGNSGPELTIFLLRI